MSWLYVLIAGIFEIGWIYSLKHSEGFTKWLPMISYAICGLSAAWFLSQSLKHLPVSTAYASWMGIAVVGSALIGMAYYKEPATLLRLVCIGLIIAGIIGLKLEQNT